MGELRLEEAKLNTRLRASFPPCRGHPGYSSLGSRCWNSKLEMLAEFAEIFYGALKRKR